MRRHYKHLAVDQHVCGENLYICTYFNENFEKKNHLYIFLENRKITDHGQIVNLVHFTDKYTRNS